MFAFAHSRPRRKPALTPMIDVVFLLLVFFMLAAQFGRDTAVTLAAGQGGAAYEGPPRLVSILPDGILVNGVAQAEAVLSENLSTLTKSPDDLIILQGRDGADVQRLTDIITSLNAAGFSNLVLVD